MPGSPTGRRADATASHLIHTCEGRPSEVSHFGDWLGWLQRAGVIPALD